MGDVVGVLQHNMLRMTERGSQRQGQGRGQGEGRGRRHTFQFSSAGKGKGKCKGGRGRGGYSGGYRGAAYDTDYDTSANDYYAGELDAYAYDDSAHHAFYGEYNEGGDDADWPGDYAYTASSAYDVTSDPNAGGCTDTFAAFSVDTNLDLDDTLDDGSQNHLGCAAEVIELGEPSGLLAVARRALHGYAKILVSAAAFAVAIAFSMPLRRRTALTGTHMRSASGTRSCGRCYLYLYIYIYIYIYICMYVCMYVYIYIYI